MRRASYVIGGFGLFLLGCVAATVVQSTASAGPAPEGVARWEYLCPGASPTRQAALNELGDAGWEMIADPNCFKRPLASR